MVVASQIWLLSPSLDNGTRPNCHRSHLCAGSCPVPGLCLLDPYTGVASFVDWNQTAFQTYLVYFAEDALTASYLTTTCHIMEGELNSTTTALRLNVTVSRSCNSTRLSSATG